MLELKIFLAIRKIPYADILKLVVFPHIVDSTDEEQKTIFIKTFRAAQINFGNEKVLYKLFSYIKDHYEFLDYEFSFEEILFFFLGKYPMFDPDLKTAMKKELKSLLQE